MVHARGILCKIGDMFKPITPQVNFPELEKKILEHWYTDGIVKKYLTQNKNSKKRFSFLDGPITANNPMGVHHAWGRTFKDLWQRFYALRGYDQRFQNGFDCQGLWVEVEVEKELGIKNKKEIENLVPGDKTASIAKFVDLCKERVLKYSALQSEQSKRLGYFMDWDHSYYTMSDENNYMIWHFLKTCFEKGWIYKGKDSVPWCPRCETAISQHEMLTEDYKELTHETVFVKFLITNAKLQINVKNVYLLVWTTTPWTVPANVAVGINTKFVYGIWKNKETDEAIIIIDKDELGADPKRTQKGKEMIASDYILKDAPGVWEKISTIKGTELLGLTYKAPFDHLPRVIEAQQENPKTFHTVVDGSQIVVSTEGTGLLHVAPGAGKEDFDLGKKEKLSIISLISDDASYLDKMDDFSGKNAKKHPELIIDFLKSKENGAFLHKTLHFTHRYPACWRCKAELVWKVTLEWYIAMDVKEKSKIPASPAGRQNPKSEENEKKTLREQMIETAKKISWHPEFGLDRELDWLSNMHDWLISKKNRYWGLALPIYECKKCDWFMVVGSKEELKEKAVEGWETFEGHTPHKPFIDAVKIVCEKCGEIVQRLDDVGNVWLDAGIVPFSTYVDPDTKKLSYTSDKMYWKKWFPIDFITESFPGQFKNWFYSMIAMSTVLEKTNPFKTVLGYASMLGEDGRPMHKSWGNSIEFNEGADKIGVDVMRWMFVSHNPTENLLFGYKKADETRRKFHLMLWNIYNFFVTNANVDKWTPKSKINTSIQTVLDAWVLARLDDTLYVTTKSMEQFDAYTSAIKIEEFVSDLSVWYIRRIRDRVGPTVTNQEDKEAAYETMFTVLTVLSRILAPFTPFLSEELYCNLTGNESVHLADWPEIFTNFKPEIKLLDTMRFVRNICEVGHAKRKELGIKVRQPLQKFQITNVKFPIDKKFEQLIKDELNVKEVSIVTGEGEMTGEFDTTISPELKAEGEARELVRLIQQKRKELGCGLVDKIEVEIPVWPKSFETYIMQETLSTRIKIGTELKIEKSK